MARKRNRPQLTRYPFVVNRNKAVALVADSLNHAIDKALAKFPGKFITTTYARAVEKYITRLNEKERVIVTRSKNGTSSASLVTDEDIMEDLLPRVKTKLKHKFFMDLQKARKEAAQQSKGGKTVHVNVKEAGDPEEGECYLSEKSDHTTYATFKNGSEIAIPVKAGKVEPAAKGKKSKTVKEPAEQVEPQSKTTKTMAKKIAKEAPAKKAAAKKETAKAKSNGKPTGKKKEISIKEIISLIKKGTKVYNHADKSLTLGYMEKMKDHSRTMPVSY